MIKNINLKNKGVQTITLVLILSTLFISCTATKQVQFKKETNTSGILGAIAQREGTLKNNVEIKGFSVLDDRLKVSVVKKELINTSLHRYRKELLSKEDSIVPSSYYEIEIIDDIKFASMINNDITASTYVKNSKNAGAITKIKIAPSNDLLMEDIDSYFLENVSEGNYSVGIYKSGKQVSLIPLSDLKIFDYEISYFCFGKDNRNQIAIMDIVEEGKRCKRPLVKKVKKLTTIKRLSQY